MTKLKIRFTATTPNDQFKGLMHQRPLKDNEGALFIFSKPKLGSFWNKNVDFPIDVGFFDEKGLLLNVEHLKANQRSPVFGKSQYKYVVEAPLHWFANNRIKEGTPYKSIINV